MSVIVIGVPGVTITSRLTNSASRPFSVWGTAPTLAFGSYVVPPTDIAVTLRDHAATGNHDVATIVHDVAADNRVHARSPKANRPATSVLGMSPRHGDRKAWHLLAHN